MTPLEILERAVASYAPHLAEDGRLIDPVLGAETQYATPYHALCRAVLAAHGPGADAPAHREAALRGALAAAAHVADPEAPHTVSGLDSRTGTQHTINHRDFFWPPILRARGILHELGADVAELDRRIAAVSIRDAFRTAAPSNWAMVWLAGEWLRMNAGLSDTPAEEIDRRLGVFFSKRMRADLGLYQEPGHSNSYDLFTRLHLAQLLDAGYDGAWAAEARRLLDAGLERSLAAQLSDGSLASAHRSTGQTWTLGAQAWFFTLAARRCADPAAARAAAQRAVGAFARWQRAEGPFSPVENRLPPAWRVGYEGYTADAHYGNLAMGFLAGAIRDGLPGQSVDPVSERPARARVENDPIFRGIAHAGRYSVHVNAAPAPGYDGHGVVDVSFGPGRMFHLVSSAAPRGEKTFVNPGMALRAEPGRGPLTVLAQQALTPIAPLERGAGGTEIRARCRVPGAPWWHELVASAASDGIRIAETAHGAGGLKTLLIPFPRDGGWGETTRARVSAESGCAVARFELGAERVVAWVEGELESALELPHGWENRRGLCGLLRIDVAGEGETLRYGFRVEA